MEKEEGIPSAMPSSCLGPSQREVTGRLPRQVGLGKRALLLPEPARLGDWLWTH